MDMNLAKFEFRKTEHCIPTYFRMEGIERDDVFYISDSEVPDILSVLRGEADYYPFFADGMYLMQFMPGGARYIVLNRYFSKGSNVKKDGDFEERWYKFPGDWFAEHLERASQLKEDETHEIDQLDIIKTGQGVRPRVKWTYGDGVPEGIDEDRARTDIYEDRDGTRDIQRCLDSVQRMAENHSDGQVIVVKFWFDFGFNRDDNRPHIYYYEVWDGEKRLWNGGVVPHQMSDGRWGYQTHS